MARVNIYLPDDVAEAARAEGLNVSALARDAVESQLAVVKNRAWLDELRRMQARWRRDGYRPPTHEDVLRALDEARDEIGDFAPPGYGC